MFRCSFLILSAARSSALRTVVPLPSPTVVRSLSSRTAWAAALSLAFSTQLISCLSILLSLFVRVVPWLSGLLLGWSRFFLLPCFSPFLWGAFLLERCFPLSVLLVRSWLGRVLVRRVLSRLRLVG